MSVSPITYVNEKTGGVPSILLLHARGDDQVPYSNALRLKAVLDYASVPNRLITPIGSANSHMLGGEVYSNTGPIFFKDQNWVVDARRWIEAYL